MSETPPVPPAAERPARPRRVARILGIAGGSSIALFVLVLIVESYWIESSSLNTQLGHLLRMMNAISMYAEDHEGRLPPTLWALIPNDIGQEDFSRYRYRYVTKGELLDWLCFPKEKLKGLPPDTILLAAPGTSIGEFGKQERLVLKPDHADSIPEAEFQRLIREQNPPPSSPPPDR